jgi:UDP-glucose 4-epimerase
VATALVTGGAGFIGSNLADVLLASGHDVHIVDNLSTGSLAKVPPTARFHELDIRDADALASLTSTIRPETVFHLAAQADVRRAIEEPVFDADVNVIGTINVLEAARTVGARVVFSSTGGAAYGEYDGLPIPTPESAVPQPMSHYGASKIAGEGYCLLYHRLYGLSVVVLRLGNVYGPRQDPHGEAGVVSIFAGRLLDGDAPRVFGDGRQTRDYVFVGDVVAAFIAAETRGDGHIINIGCGREVSVLDLLDGLASPVPPEFAPARPGELQRSALANDLARSVLGWRPATPLADGLRITRAAIAVTHGRPDARPPGFVEMLSTGS